MGSAAADKELRQGSVRGVDSACRECERSQFCMGRACNCRAQWFSNDEQEALRGSL